MLALRSNVLFPQQEPVLETGLDRTCMDAGTTCKRPRLSPYWVAVSCVLCFFWQLAIGDVNVPGHAPASEYSSKADSLAMLLDWVKWPTPAPAQVNVGILGDDPFGSALEKMNPKRSKQIEDLKGCQIIFIANSEKEKVPAIIESLAGANVLTVGESEGFAKQGGMIGFVMENDLVRFEINTGATRQAGLKIDLRLLKLAKRVFNS